MECEGHVGPWEFLSDPGGLAGRHLDVWERCWATVLCSRGLLSSTSHGSRHVQIRTKSRQPATHPPVSHLRVPSCFQGTWGSKLTEGRRGKQIMLLVNIILCLLLLHLGHMQSLKIWNKHMCVIMRLLVASQLERTIKRQLSFWLTQVRMGGCGSWLCSPHNNALSPSACWRVSLCHKSSACLCS